MSSQVIDEYLAQLSDADRKSLTHIRTYVLTIVPDATEVITYGMPGFKYRGKYLLAYSAFKDHLSVFPGAHAIAELASLLSDFKTAKGTVQFTRENPLPDEMLKALVLTRKADIEAASK